MQSSILNENRKVLIKLPQNYHKTTQTYPVIYRLDGDLDLFSETVGTINQVVNMEEAVPDMIVVLIENTKRNRDMMPTKTSFFTTEPGADKFKQFIEKELIPHINFAYRTSGEKILCGQSLNAIFTLYYFLTSTETFDSYISCNGDFQDVKISF